jgi:hypothetical protein
MLDVTQSRELQATIYALRQARRDIRLDINKTARNRLKPLWIAELGARARTRVERRVILTGARVTASDRGLKFVAASSTRPLRGGLVPSWQWAGYEFGARTQRIQVRQRSRRGRAYVRNLTINRQFRGRQQDGMIAFDAASKAGTRLVATWVETTVDAFRRVPAVEVTR